MPHYKYRYFGSEENLRRNIEATGFKIMQVKQIPSGVSFCLEGTVYCNWWPKKGTIYIQGNEQNKQKFVEFFAETPNLYKSE